MKLGTWLFAILVLAVAMGISRDEVGRVAVIVFVTGVAVIASGLAAILALFRTIAALGEARNLFDHLEAMAATVGVLAIGSTIMIGLFFAGARMVTWAVP